MKHDPHREHGLQCANKDAAAMKHDPYREHGLQSAVLARGGCSALRCTSSAASWVRQPAFARALFASADPPTSVGTEFEVQQQRGAGEEDQRLSLIHI
eukprot:809080-Alexandrium_andersonii.AAC.1